MTVVLFTCLFFVGAARGQGVKPNCGLSEWKKWRTSHPNASGIPVAPRICVSLATSGYTCLPDSNWWPSPDNSTPVNAIDAPWSQQRCAEACDTRRSPPCTAFVYGYESYEVGGKDADVPKFCSSAPNSTACVLDNSNPQCHVPRCYLRNIDGLTMGNATCASFNGGGNASCSMKTPDGENILPWGEFSVYVKKKHTTAAKAISDTAPAAVIRSFSELGGKPYTVSYNARGLLLNNRSLLAFSGSVHYPRSTPSQWRLIFASMKASGLNAVDSYVFWNFHVRSNSTTARAQPDYSGRGNVTLFLTLAAEADLFVIWRLGPYINAEWLDGGYPSWVKQECKANGMRNAVQPYMDLTTEWMQSHVATISPFFSNNGGPIILLQMDNELGGAAPDYIQFLQDLAEKLVPSQSHGPLWTMCHGQHFNGSLLTCNGVSGPHDGCRKFARAQIEDQHPAMWTEDEQWYDRFGQAQSLRNASSSARGLATFVAVGGSLHNFYMWHGGTMWGNWSDTNRGSRLTPSYANSAPLASDGSLNAAKHTVLTNFHRLALKHADSIMGTKMQDINQTVIGGDPTKCKQSCMPWCDGTCQWSVEMAGDTSSVATGTPPIPLAFLCNDDEDAATVTHATSATDVRLEGRSCKVLHAQTGAQLWDSHVPPKTETPAPYVAIPSLAPGKLKWTKWPQHSIDVGLAPKHEGDWYRTQFALVSTTKPRSISINLTGFSAGNLFVNGHHVAYFNLAPGDCSDCAKGEFGCWPMGTYTPTMCGKPTQQYYAVPPEWLVTRSGDGDGGDNELLVFNAAPGYCVPTADVAGDGPCTHAKQNNMMPPNITNPELASVVMREFGA